MRLAEYLASLGDRRRGEKARLAREAGVTWNTIHVHIKTGEPIAMYDTAKRISAATGGAVSIAELCERAPAALEADDDAEGEGEAASPRGPIAEAAR